VEPTAGLVGGVERLADELETAGVEEVLASAIDLARFS
jgi:hypothetical protein